MDDQAKIDYDAHQKSLAITHGVIETALLEGKDDGKVEGKEFIVCNAYKLGVEISLIASISQFSESEVVEILKRHNIF